MATMTQVRARGQRGREGRVQATSCKGGEGIKDVG
jgi:hypothetical protein